MKRSGVGGGVTCATGCDPDPAALAARSVLAEPSLDASLAFAAAVIPAAAGEVDSGTAVARQWQREHGSSAGYQHMFLTLGWLFEGDATAAMAHAALVPVHAEIKPLLKAVCLDALSQRGAALALLAEARTGSRCSRRMP